MSPAMEKRYSGSYTTKMSEYKIHLPSRYHPKQLAVIHSKAKRKVLVWGRRAGKTRTDAVLAVTAFLDNKRVLEAAPKFDQTTVFWRYVKRMLRDPLAAGVLKKNESSRIIENEATGNWLRSMTAYDADSLRSDAADLLILDEFQDMKPDAWDEVGAPMMLDTDGDAVFSGTPKRKNHFFNMYASGLGDTTGRWMVEHITSHDNPFLSQVALKEIIADMTDEAYRQEIMAEFLDNEGAVFRNIGACMGAPESTPDKHKGHRTVAGLDWAKQRDYTAISIGCADCKVEVARDRFNRIDYAFQRERIKALVTPWGIDTILAERNSIGEPNLEQMQRDGLPVVGFETTSASKPPLIENLSLALQKVEWQFQPDPVWKAEMEAYEMKVNPNTGRSSYSAPEGVNDDTVIARALMLRAAGSKTFEVVDSPFDF